MPRIPRVESRAEITPRAPAVKQPVAAARRVGLGIIEAGKTLENIGAMYQRARDLNQYTNAKTDIATRTLEVENNAANTEINNTEDFNNVIKTSKEGLQKIKDDILPTISNPETRIKMGGSLDLSSLSTLNSIKRDGRRRWVDAMEANRKRNIEAFTNIYVETEDPIKKQTALNDIRESYTNHIKTGVINKTKGLKELKETLVALPVLDAENMIEKNPVEARRMLAKDEFGDVGKEKEKLFKLADTTIERNKKKAKDVFNFKKDQTMQEAAEMIAKEEITSISQIDKLPRVSEEFKKAAKRLVLSKEKIDAKTIAVVNERLARQYDNLKLDEDGNTEEGFEKLERYRINVMNAHDKGAVSKEKMLSKLKEVHGAYTEDLGEIVGVKFKQKRGIRSFWNSLLKSTYLIPISPVAVPFVGAKISKMIAERIVGKKLPEEAQAEAMDFLDDELTKVFDKGEIPEGKVDEVAVGIFEKYIKTQHPEILGLPEMPSGIISQEEPLEILKKGISPDLKPDIEIKRKPGLILMKNPQGDPGWVPIEQREDALKQGFTLEGK